MTIRNVIKYRKIIGNKINSFVDSMLILLEIAIRIIRTTIYICVPIYILYVWNFDKAQYILNFIQNISWPIVALFVIFVFKIEIVNLLNRIIKIALPNGQQIVFGNDSSSQKKTKNPDSLKIEDFKDIVSPYKIEINKLGNDVDKLRKELTDTQIYLDFEKIYNVIFGSQITLLKILKLNEDNNNFFYNDQLMNNYFENIKKSWPQNLQSWTTLMYVNYLLNMAHLMLYNSESDQYTITPKGRAFLSYIQLLGYSDEKGLL